MGKVDVLVPGSLDASSDEDVPTCPLCMEELDATDLAVKACRCGYQVCLYCLHTIREQMNGKCPACRTPYEEKKFEVREVDREEAAKIAKERAEAKKERERRLRQRELEKERERAAMASEQRAKMNLKHSRIIQRSLVYVIGLSQNLAREETLRRNEILGRFGRILFILVNRTTTYNPDAPGGPSLSAYVQFARETDASQAVRAMNGEVLDGRELRLAIATTKYCDAFISTGVPTHCGNPNCLYLHELAPSEDALTREEVISNQLGPPPPQHLIPTQRRLHPTPAHPGGSGPGKPQAPTSAPNTVLGATPTPHHAAPHAARGSESPGVANGRASPPSRVAAANGINENGRASPPSRVAAANGISENGRASPPSRVAAANGTSENSSAVGAEVPEDRRGEASGAQQAKRGAETAWLSPSGSTDGRGAPSWSGNPSRSRHAPPHAHGRDSEATSSPPRSAPSPPGFEPPPSRGNPARPAAGARPAVQAQPPGFERGATATSTAHAAGPRPDVPGEDAKDELNDVLQRLGKMLGIEDALASGEVWSAPSHEQPAGVPQMFSSDRDQSRFGFAQSPGGSRVPEYYAPSGARHPRPGRLDEPRAAEMPAFGLSEAAAGDKLGMMFQAAEQQQALEGRAAGGVEMPPPGFGVSIDPFSLMKMAEEEGGMHGERPPDEALNQPREGPPAGDGFITRTMGRAEVPARYEPALRRSPHRSAAVVNKRPSHPFRDNEAPAERLVTRGPNSKGAPNDAPKSVNELEREVEAARAREAVLQNRLAALQQRISSYDTY